MRSDASSLLRIDYEAAIDKLAGAQLQGSWQLPAELARLAIASGARSVAFEVEPRHLVMTAPGARWDHRTVAGFASVLDRRLEAADRHRAMVELEEDGAFVLSAIACSPLRSLALTAGGVQGLKLRLSPSGELTVANPIDSDLARPDIQLAVEGLAIDAGRAGRWLRRVGRFSQVPISIDGGRIPGGFHKPLIEKRFEIPPQGSVPGASRLPAALAIAARGAAPHLWLLRHGIIATHATVPGYPAFEAAIEMAALSVPETSPAGDSAAPPVASAISRPAPSPESAAPRMTSSALRERLGSYVEPLVDAAVALTIELGESAGSLPEAARARTARLLLRSALKRRRLSEVSGVRVFPLLGTGGRRRRLVSIDVIGRLVRVEEGGTCALDAIPPGQDPKRYALVGQGALAVSQGERALLGELLSAVFSQPPARARQSPMRRLLALAAERLPELRARGTPIADSELSAAERALLSRLAGETATSAIAASAGAEFRTGQGKVRRDGNGKLQLPRDNPTVAACVRAVERDAAWSYPAAVALLAGRELPDPELRRQWYARLDASG